VSNPESASLFYVSQGTAFTDTFDYLTETWTPMDVGRAVVPESVKLSAGAEPGKLVFHVYADSAYNNTGVYPPIGSKVDPAGKRPDGGVGGLSLPSYENAPIKPFTTIKLTEDDPEGTIRFVGVVLAADLELETDTWIVTALEIPRWRFSKYVLSDELWHDTNYEGNEAPAPTNPVLFRNSLPVFNADGKRDMWVDVEGNRQLRFYHPDFKYAVVGYIVKFWRLGDILNYLRLLYYVINPDTGKTILGIDGCSSYLQWDEVTEVDQPWLFEVDGKEQVVPDFALGGMTLLEAIDTTIRKAGDGAEWTVGFAYTTPKWTLDFYDKSGNNDLALDRGQVGTVIGDECVIPSITGGHIGYNWINSATSVKVFGQVNVHEITVAYDPDGEMHGVFPDLLKPAWETNDQTDYQEDELAYCDHHTTPVEYTPGDLYNVRADSVYPSVFTKYRFREDKNWSPAFGATEFPTCKQGIRDLMAKMVTKTLTGNEEIIARAWRFEAYNAGTGTCIFTAMPKSISLSVNHDGSLNIVGEDPLDDPLAFTQNNSKERRPRWLCDVDAGAVWAVRPFVITFTVIGDARAVGEDSTTPPDGWPEGLEDTPDISKQGNEWRYKALHLLDADDKPVEDNPAVVGLRIKTGLMSAVPEKVKNNQDTLNAAATRRKAQVERPECEGSMILGGNFNWQARPGTRIVMLTGGGAPALPDLYLGVLIQSVEFGGLSNRDTLKREQRIEISNG